MKQALANTAIENPLPQRDNHNIRFKFAHLRGISRKHLEAFVAHATVTGQIGRYRRPLVPFRDILRANDVTVCTAYDGEKPVAQGYAFCRGDMYDKSWGRWKAEQRVRVQLSLDLKEDPKEKKLRYRELAKLKARQEALEAKIKLAKMVQRGEIQIVKEEKFDPDALPIDPKDYE